MAAPDTRAIDWASAHVDDGTLKVRLAGRGSKGWKRRFDGVVALLDRPHTNWGEVRLEKSALVVDQLREGSEPALRHFLESAVLQANSDTHPGEPVQYGQGEGDGGERAPGPDERMTSTFRAFGDAGG